MSAIKKTDDAVHSVCKKHYEIGTTLLHNGRKLEAYKDITN